MAKGLSVSIVDWLNTDVAELAQQRLVELVEQNKQRVLSEQAQRSGGIEPALTTMIVDGKRNAGVADIKRDSRVILDWNYLTEAVIKVVGYLRLHGPERSGRWKESVLVLINGKEQSPDEPIPPSVEHATVVVAVPYSRKLEVGRTKSGRAFSIQVPQHFVESAVTRLRSELRDLANLSFTYVDLAGAATLTAAGQHRRSFRHGHAERTATKRSGETTTRFPAIVIDEIEAVA